MHWFDCLLIGPSIVAFTKTLALNHKFINWGHVPGQQQMIGGTKQLFSPRNEWSKDLSRLTTTSTLEHQHLQAGTFYDSFYTASKRFVQSKCDKYSIGTLQAASCNKCIGAFSDKVKARQEKRQEQEWRFLYWKQDRDKMTEQGRSETREKQLKMQSNLDLRWDEVRWKKKSFFKGSTLVLSFTPQPFNISRLSNVLMSISRLHVAQTVRQHFNGYLDTFQYRKHRTYIRVSLFSTT